MDTHTTPFGDRFLSKEEAATYTGLRPRSLDKLVEKGELTVFRPIISGSRNRKMLFKKSDLDALLERYRYAAIPQGER